MTTTPPPPPTANTLTFTFNKATGSERKGQASGSTSDGSSIVRYNLVSQSFATTDYTFTWNSTSGVFTMYGTGSDAHLSIGYSVTDSAGATSSTAYITVYFR